MRHWNYLCTSTLHAYALRPFIPTSNSYVKMAVSVPSIDCLMVSNNTNCLLYTDLNLNPLVINCKRRFILVTLVACRLQIFNLLLKMYWIRSLAKGTYCRSRWWYPRPVYWIVKAAFFVWKKLRQNEFYKVQWGPYKIIFKINFLGAFHW